MLMQRIIRRIRETSFLREERGQERLFPSLYREGSIGEGVSVLYFTADGLFQYFSKLMREGVEDEYITEADVLLLDDLGTEFSNSFTASRFFNLLNQRILSRKTMIISTNLNFKDLRELYSDRVVSRMMSDYEIIPLYGRDQRLG